MTEHKDLLHLLTAGRDLPDGCDQWGIRSVHPDFRSSRDFRWPFPGQVAKAPGPIDEKNTDGCPSHTGDGICLAKSWRGMASGGIPALTLLLVAYAGANSLGATEPEHKHRVRECVVVDVIDGARLVREHGDGADLYGADLYGADLYGADLYGANLCGANLYGADLRGANLCGANLCGANLCGANLCGANLRGANLRGADLCGADASRYTLCPAGWQVSDGRIVRDGSP